MPDDLLPVEELPKAAAVAVPDAHGEAALMLVESLIHELLAQATLSHAQVLNVIEIAIDAQIQVSDDRGDDRSRMSRAAHFLSALHASIAIDGQQE